MHNPAQLCRCCGRVHQRFCGKSKGSASTCIPSIVNHPKTPPFQGLLYSTYFHCSKQSSGSNPIDYPPVSPFLSLHNPAYSYAPANGLILLLQTPPHKAQLQFFYPWSCPSQPIMSHQPRYWPFPPLLAGKGGPNLGSPGWASESPLGNLEVLLET